MTTLATHPAEQFLVGERVITPPVRDAVNALIQAGGAGVLTRVTEAGGGDQWFWVRIDGAPIDYPFFARQLRKEPTI